MTRISRNCPLDEVVGQWRWNYATRDLSTRFHDVARLSAAAAFNAGEGGSLIRAAGATAPTIRANGTGWKEGWRNHHDHSQRQDRGLEGVWVSRHRPAIANGTRHHLPDLVH